MCHGPVLWFVEATIVGDRVVAELIASCLPQTRMGNGKPLIKGSDEASELG